MGQRPFRSAYIIPQQRANGGKWLVFNNKKFGILLLAGGENFVRLGRIRNLKKVKTAYQQKVILSPQLAIQLKLSKKFQKQLVLSIFNAICCCRVLFLHGAKQLAIRSLSCLKFETAKEVGF